MGNIIYILSMAAALLWLVAYFVVNNISPMIHLLIIAAFIGIITSLFIDNDNSTLKDNKNLHV